MKMKTPKGLILLVEDDPRLRASITRALTDEGFEVQAAAEYRAAVIALTRVTPMLVCLELALPSESGYELCEHIRGQAHLAGVSILAMNDRGSPEDMAYAEHVGADAYLIKPFTRDRLLHYVGTMCSDFSSILRLPRRATPPAHAPRV